MKASKVNRDMGNNFIGIQSDLSEIARWIHIENSFVAFKIFDTSSEWMYTPG